MGSKSVTIHQAKSESVVRNKSFAFAMRIVNLDKYLCQEKEEHILSQKILSSGTAIGAMVREAEEAESKGDFIHKMVIALKEAHKTKYGILLLHQTEYIQDKACQSLQKDLVEILKLLVSIIKTTKEKYQYKTQPNIQRQLL